MCSILLWIKKAFSNKTKLITIVPSIVNSIDRDVYERKLITNRPNSIKTCSFCDFCKNYADHVTCEHVCGTCNRIGDHASHNHINCNLCVNNDHVTENHKCTKCNGFGHLEYQHQCKKCNGPHQTHLHPLI
jgi:hypothetical protein